MFRWYLVIYCFTDNKTDNEEIVVFLRVKLLGC